MKKILTIKNTHSLYGTINVPGDKSISHRSLIFASLASGRSIVNGFLAGLDCLATLDILCKLGVHIKFYKNNLKIFGIGINGLIATNKNLNCVNSALACDCYLVF